jgi:hypothetical protein
MQNSDFTLPAKTLILSQNKSGNVKVNVKATKNQFVFNSALSALKSF